MNVVSMTRARAIRPLDEYEQAIEDIIAVCKGDVRGALVALMALNEELELRLEQMSAQADAQRAHPLERRLH